MRRCLGFLLGIVFFLSGCSTPYSPPKYVYGSTDFRGVVDLLSGNDAPPVDLIMVHGMGAYSEADANAAIDLLAKSIDANNSVLRKFTSPPRNNAIQLVQRTVQFGEKGKVRFSALIWAPLTTALKRQLDYDQTGTPTDCTVVGECKPTRASINGDLIDTLMNQNLADVLVYQGKSKQKFTDLMVEAIQHVISSSEPPGGSDASETRRPLIFVTESLGSKISFDALTKLLGSGSSLSDPAKESVAGQMTLFMHANQLPILSLADQDIASAGPGRDRVPSEDALKKLLDARQEVIARSRALRQANVVVVAFTDPNDVLSYRLMGSRYANSHADIADVLVSNADMWFGILEMPNKAHTGYKTNTDVATVIACGKPKSTLCK